MVEKELSAELEQALALALRLSPVDKARLVERVASNLVHDVEVQPAPKPLKTFRGVLEHLGAAPTDEDIAEVRREMMRNFPRDIDL